MSESRTVLINRKFMCTLHGQHLFSIPLKLSIIVRKGAFNDENSLTGFCRWSAHCLRSHASLPWSARSYYNAINIYNKNRLASLPRSEASLPPCHPSTIPRKYLMTQCSWKSLRVPSLEFRFVETKAFPHILRGTMTLQRPRKRRWNPPLRWCRAVRRLLTHNYELALRRAIEWKTYLISSQLLTAFPNCRPIRHENNKP